jgi:hypothetical protein
MERAKKELDTFLNELVNSYPQVTMSKLNPATIEEIGVKSRDFFEKAKNKINELASKNNGCQKNLTVNLQRSLLNIMGF